MRDWEVGIKATVLSKTGTGTATGGAEAAAELLAYYGWSDGTWRNRLSQLRRWMVFCDEDGRCPRPATEGDVLAYIGYLSIEGKVGPRSVRQYVTSISRYHEDGGFESPTKTRLVRAVMDAYGKKADAEGEVGDVRAGCPAAIMREVVALGLQALDIQVVCSCAMATFAFVFQCRSVSVAHLKPSDITFRDGGVEAVLFRKGQRRHSRPLRIDYPRSEDWEEGSTSVDLLEKWKAIRPPSAGFFDLQVRDKAGTASLRAGLERALSLVKAEAEKGYYYATHSPRIGGFNELVQLGFSRAWLMHRLDWASEAMFQVYFDGSIRSTPDSEWFFAHMRAPA